MDTTPSSTGPHLAVDSLGLAVLTFDDPGRGANVLTREVMTTLAGHLETVGSEAAKGQIHALLIRSGKADSFIAGADVSAIAAIGSVDEGVESARLGQAIYQRLADLPIPTLAAVHGFCMGGGTELALACDVRAISDAPGSRFALPEVQLGILPGWGGTTRLPRLVGLQAALDLLLTGKACKASKAERIGLADHVFPASQFEERTEELARQLAAGPWDARRPKRPFVTRLLEGNPVGRAVIRKAARKQVLKLTDGNYPAPLRILDVVAKSEGESLSTALDYEALALGELIVSPECRGLVHVFNLRERARKAPWAAGGEASSVDHIAVIGAGVMGGGIAQLAAYNGITARIKDIRHEAVASGLAYAEGIFAKAVQRRKLMRREAAQKMSLISGGVDYAGVQNADVVIEAVVERMDVKKAVLAEVETKVSDEAILATNTSSLSVDEMSAELSRPGKFGGMHFFNPVHRMPLVEIVRGSRTSADTVETLAALAVRLGKVPVVTGDGPGFLVNRILAPYLNEAGFLLDEGFDAEAIDRIWKRFGMPMGPYRLIDEVGIDVMRHAGETMHQAFGKRMSPAPSLEALGESGRLGKKGDLGFYVYENGKQAGFDPHVYEAAGVHRSREDPDEAKVIQRLSLTMINEAARILGEGIVNSAGDVDLGMIMGTGFPPFRGGLLKHADTLGSATVLSLLQGLETTHGSRFGPSEVLIDLARQNTSFYKAFPSPSR